MIRASFAVRRRGLFLALIGVVWVLIGYSYLALTPAENAALKHALRDALPGVNHLWGWGIAWIVCGALALLDGLRPGVRSMIGFTAAVVMPTAWALVYFAAWLQGDIPRGWVSGVIFAALAGAIMIVASMPDVPAVARP